MAPPRREWAVILTAGGGWPSDQAVPAAQGVEAGLAQHLSTACHLRADPQALEMAVANSTPESAARMRAARRYFSLTCGRPVDAAELLHGLQTTLAEIHSHWEITITVLPTADGPPLGSVTVPATPLG